MADNTGVGVGLPGFRPLDSPALGSIPSIPSKPSIPDLPPRFLGVQNRYRSIVLALDVATTNHMIEFPGNVLAINYASIATALIKVRFGESVNDEIFMLPGSSINDLGYEKLYISWTAQAGEYVHLTLVNVVGDFSPIFRV